MRRLSEEPLPGVLPVGGGWWSWKKKVKINHFFVFPPIVFGSKLFCDILHNERPTSTWHCCCSFVDSPQQSVDSTWSQTCLLLLTVQTHPKYRRGKRAYGWLPLMASSSGGEIVALCAESFCERILSEANDVCHKGNTLLDTEEITMLGLLRINGQFIQYMCEICPKLSSQNFNGTLV